MDERIVAALLVVIGIAPLFVLGFYFRSPRGARVLQASGKGKLRDAEGLAAFIGNGLLRIGAAHLPFAAALPFLTEPQVLVAALVFAAVVVALAIHFALGLLKRQSS